MDNNIGWWLTKRTFLTPQREAYVGDDGERLTFDALNHRCNRTANAFLAAGIAKGERVALLLMNSSEFVEAYFALAKIGAVVVPLNWRLVADELEFILKDSGATRLIFDDDFVDTVADLHSRGDKTDIVQWLQVTSGESAYFASDYRAFRDAAEATEPPVRAGDDDMLYIMYTSGTTGLPKGVVHTHNTCIWGLHYDRGQHVLPARRPFSVALADVPRRGADANHAVRLSGRYRDRHAQLRSSPRLAASGRGEDHHRLGGAGEC